MLKYRMSSGYELAFHYPAWAAANIPRLTARWLDFLMQKVVALLLRVPLFVLFPLVLQPFHLHSALFFSLPSSSPRSLLSVSYPTSATLLHALPVFLYSLLVCSNLKVGLCPSKQKFMECIRLRRLIEYYTLYAQPNHLLLRV